MNIEPTVFIFVLQPEFAFTHARWGEMCEVSQYWPWLGSRWQRMALRPGEKEEKLRGHVAGDGQHED